MKNYTETKREERLQDVKETLLTVEVEFNQNISTNVSGFMTPLDVAEFDKSGTTFHIYKTRKFGNVYYCVGNVDFDLQLDLKGSINRWIGLGSETEQEAIEILTKFIKEWCYSNSFVEEKTNDRFNELYSKTFVSLTRV